MWAPNKVPFFLPAHLTDILRDEQKRCESDEFARSLEENGLLRRIGLS